ncbi:hypothetical protein [Alteromonas sp. BMJM2]|uniref:hypothetical protein n=1 Tax=Alteromonas sp. BMJM2 TaxID=2954241 RepID=UPI0022B4B930|nr:hypothetical protein [Alteromonas sp. BMJM2]
MSIVLDLAATTNKAPVDGLVDRRGSRYLEGFQFSLDAAALAGVYSSLRAQVASRVDKVDK